MNILVNRQNLFIRKLNGIGEKINVINTLTIKQLKNIVKSLKSLESSSLTDKNFDLVFKGNIISKNQSITLKELSIPQDAIIHLLFVTESQNKLVDFPSSNSEYSIRMPIIKQKQINLRIIFNYTEYKLIGNDSDTVLDLKKRIAARLNLVYESLVLVHLGTQMINDKQLSAYNLEDQTLISLKFNLHKPEKKKLESRMVSSVTFSDQNNQPNTRIGLPEFEQIKSKQPSSSKSFGLDKDEGSEGLLKLKSLLNSNNRPMMYKSDINSLSSSQGASKAALIFKNVLHQKIIETESIVSGSFSEDTSITGYDPNSVMITVKNQEDTKEFIFECSKSHQITDLREILTKLQRAKSGEKIEISTEQQLFKSIDLNKSGCVTLNQMTKKIGKQRAVFIYRII